jgi:L-methionine (R)-S-oxide reductase
MVRTVTILTRLPRNPFHMTRQSEYTQSWLLSLLTDFDCQTGTLHRSDEASEWLHLVVCQGIPEFLLEKITRIPFGKGIAGVAASEKRPVQLCNLQQDLGGIAKPDARQTGVSGSLAVPILSPDGSRVLGTLGIGKIAPYEFTEDESARLTAIAAEIGSQWAS